MEMGRVYFASVYFPPDVRVWYVNKRKGSQSREGMLPNICAVFGRNPKSIFSPALVSLAVAQNRSSSLRHLNNSLHLKYPYLSYQTLFVHLDKIKNK